MELYRRWKETRLSPQVHKEVLTLAASIRDLLHKGDFDSANQRAAKLHILSQNHVVLHAYGHWVFTKVYVARGERRPALRHAYLMVMAPYGTVVRRLRGEKLDSDG